MTDAAPQVRPLTEDDLTGVAVVTAAAFGIDVSDENSLGRWIGRLRHLLDSDPDGSWVAEAGGRIIGAAQACVRERLWSLSLLAVQPSTQSRGAGRALLDRTLGYGAHADAGLIVSSNDPRALRLYTLAGFAPRATFATSGALDRRRLPRADRGVTEAGLEDLEELAPLSRAVRGAAHTREIAFALGRGARLMRHGDRGLAVVQPGQGVWLLVARDEPAAQALLWAALANADDTNGPPIRWITSEQTWAIEVVLQAGFGLCAHGALCVRGDPGLLRPFVPSPPFA